MKNNFVADGLSRFLRGQKNAQSKSIEQKCAAELANAGPDENGKIRERMAAEILRREKVLNHKPSSATLW